MESGLKTKRLRIGGMTCVNCQHRIEKKLRNTAGVESAEVSYNDAAAAVTYDTDMITLKDITAIIEEMDYRVLSGQQPTPANRKAIGILIIVLAGFMLLNQWGLSGLFNLFPTAAAHMGYGMLFIIGLLTSIHCVAMCGGLNLSQCISRPDIRDSTGKGAVLRPGLLYNAGRVASYTVIGGIVGALGSVISLTGAFRGLIQLIAGAFMIIMGLNMLNLFPGLRAFTPRLPGIFARTVRSETDTSKNPLIVGLLNGLMPCGPLQAMQIYALSTGSPLTGALSMLLFSLGTVPLMFGLGALSSLLSHKFTSKVMTVGAALVVALGLSMFSQGWSLSGLPIDFLPGPRISDAAENTPGAVPGAVPEDGYQRVNSTLQSGRYPAITVQAGIPVKWVIDAPEGSINGCNNRMMIPKYKIEHSFVYGENLIEFTPTETGIFPYSCWMGMIRSSVTVTEPEGAANEPAANESAADNPASAAPDETTPDPFFDPEAPWPEPVPANATIPTDALAIAEFGTIDADDGEEYEIQRVAIELTGEGYRPAIIVVQAGMDVEWTIYNTSAGSPNFTLLAPSYNTRLDLLEGANLLYLFPTEDFVFSNGDSAFYGYVKVVSDLNAVDEAAVRAQVAAYETQIYPPEIFTGGGDTGGGCGDGARKCR